MPRYVVTGRSAKTNKPLKRDKELYAKSEEEARELAMKGGMIAEAIELKPFLHCLSEVVGIGHKNSDNTSRQKAIERCRRGTPLVFVKESGNKHDANAVRIETQDGTQIGYLHAGHYTHAGISAALIGFWLEHSDELYYSAVVHNIKPSYSGDLMIPEFALVIAQPRQSDEAFRKYLSETEELRRVTPQKMFPPMRLMDTRPVLVQARKGDRSSRREPEVASGGSCSVLILMLVCVVIGILALV